MSITTVAFRRKDPIRPLLAKLAHHSTVVRRYVNLGHLTTIVLFTRLLCGINVVLRLGKLQGLA